MRTEQFYIKDLSNEEFEALAIDNCKDGEYVNWESTEYLDEIRNLTNGSNIWYANVYYVSTKKTQRDAIKRYRKKNPNRERNLQFCLPKNEADEIDNYIKSTELSKADFLRKSIKAHQEKKF